MDHSGIRKAFNTEAQRLWPLCLCSRQPQEAGCEIRRLATDGNFAGAIFDVAGAQERGPGDPAGDYPGESHEINRPSFVPDRMERYLAWYGEHLGVSPAVPSTGGR
jgi:hypothetical protein